jgi:hypothetical protein
VHYMERETVTAYASRSVDGKRLVETEYPSACATGQNSDSAALPMCTCN